MNFVTPWALGGYGLDDAGDPNGTHYGDIDPLLHKAANAVRRWPSGDLSGKYF